jgi:hypothetical protein
MEAIHKYFASIDAMTSFIDKTKYLQLRVPLYAPIRFYPAAQFNEGSYVLFDRTTANAAAWGSNTKVGSLGQILDDIDMPKWFIQPNKTMPPDRYFLAEYMAFDWQPTMIQTGLPYYINSTTFMQDKMRIRNNPMYIEFRPQQKDVDMRIPINQINDLNDLVVREVATVTAPANTTYYNHMVNTRQDQHAGLYPFFSDELNVAGMFYEPNSIIDIQLVNYRDIPAAQIVSQIYLRIMFIGWYYRPL